jgi:hypothetical protein
VTALLMVLTIIVAVLFFGALVGYMVAITGHLDSIGRGPQSSLAMITWGVRAIESETSYIPKQVPLLNQQLTAAAGALKQIDDGLVAVAGAAAAQEVYR